MVAKRQLFLRQTKSRKSLQYFLVSRDCVFLGSRLDS